MAEHISRTWSRNFETTSSHMRTKIHLNSCGFSGTSRPCRSYTFLPRSKFLICGGHPSLYRILLPKDSQSCTPRFQVRICAASGTHCHSKGFYFIAGIYCTVQKANNSVSCTAVRHANWQHRIHGQDVVYRWIDHIRAVTSPNFEIRRLSSSTCALIVLAQVHKVSF